MLNVADEAKKLLEALEAEGLDYALCGALALAVHGVVRATTDIDMLVDRSSVDAVAAVAKRLGYIFPAAPMGFRDGVELRRISKIVDAQVLTLDLMIWSEVYRSVWESRIRVRILDAEISAVSRDGLILMKTMAARPKDLDDVARLQEIDR